MPVRARPRACAVAAALLVTGVAVAGCGDAGGLQGAGPTPTAEGPARLWPALPPASSPAYEIGEVERQVVKGVRVPGGDVRTVDPVAVVRTEIDASPGDYEGTDAPYRETGARLADCAAGAGHGRCPVLTPYYRDLTGDGHDDLTLGFRQLPGELTAVRVYTVERNRLVRVMSWDDAISGVELAGRSVIIRSPSEVQGYEYRLQWSWDRDQKAMLLTHDEMLRTDRGAPSPTESRGTPSPAESRGTPSPTESRR
ncbi:hypothetical protein [Streptomyces sp.]|uniref:hypothetical protein n=1 Tax=Streptomyces sp. TaxID=1931 RepID=UPI002D60BCB4|nr:hypothetical protein [Streptomyces sp.]HZF90171.1 hypothetical protein [Streptomyces sp.]